MLKRIQHHICVKMDKWTNSGQHAVPIYLGSWQFGSHKLEGADGTQKGEMELARELDTGYESCGLGVTEQTSW